MKIEIKFVYKSKKNRALRVKKENPVKTFDKIYLSLKLVLY